MINREALKDAKAFTAHDANVVGVSWGYKTRDGKLTYEQGVIIQVKQKKSLASLTTRDIIPKVMCGAATDVCGGEFQAYGTVMHSPYQGGDSYGHENITAGTCGGAVLLDGQRVAISNAHVVYPHWEGAKIGDRVTHPGPHDIKEQGGVVWAPAYDAGVTLTGGTINFRDFKLPGKKNQELAKLWWKAVRAVGNFGAQAVKCPYRVNVSPYQVEQPTPNLFDVGFVDPVFTPRLAPGIRSLGHIVGITDPVLGMKLVKHGRTTDVTRGVVSSISADSAVSYGSGLTADFTQQGLARGNNGGEFSAGGDSGSMIFTTIGGELFWVGLLFAGGGGQTVFNLATNIIKYFPVQLI